MFSIRMDRAGENKNKEIKYFSLENGNVLDYSSSNARKSNGAAERLIQEFWKVTRIFICESKLQN